MQIVECANCGNEDIELSIEIFITSKTCPTCFHMQNEYLSKSFCSKKCFDEWYEKNKKNIEKK